MSVITEGYYVVFDAFWDYEVEHLSDNFCPPAVEHIPGNPDAFPATEPQNNRSDAKIHVSKTAFSIPTSYEVTVIDTDNPISDPGHDDGPDNITGDTIDLVDYPFLRDAVSAVGPDPDSTAGESPGRLCQRNNLVGQAERAGDT